MLPKRKSDNLISDEELKKAFIEWRDAASAWSDFHRNLKEHPATGSINEKWQQLRLLEKQLNTATGKYVDARMKVKMMQMPFS
jgi:hypothetical protein